MFIPNVLQSSFDRGLRLIERLSAVAPLLIRLTVGLVFATTGWGKLHSLPDVTAFFQTLNIPFPALNAAVVAGTATLAGFVETSYLVMFLVLVIIGPGAISVDQALARGRARRVQRIDHEGHAGPAHLTGTAAGGRK
jgi:uncharacterized membrane protein YphA (DoxX/SURF4 family)